MPILYHILLYQASDISGEVWFSDCCFADCLLLYPFFTAFPYFPYWILTWGLKWTHRNLGLCRLKICFTQGYLSVKWCHEYSKTFRWLLLCFSQMRPFHPNSNYARAAVINSNGGCFPSKCLKPRLTSWFRSPSGLLSLHFTDSVVLQNSWVYVWVLDLITHILNVFWFFFNLVWWT